MKRFACSVSLVALLVLPACVDWQDTHPHNDLTFSPRGYIAAGATILLDVRQLNRGPAKLTSVTSDHPERLAVTSFEDGLVVLQAGETGIVHIDARTATSESGHDFFVKAIASSTLLFEGSPGLPQEGIAVTPGADYSFRLEHFDERGNELAGFAAEPITATPASALVREPDSDSFHLVAPSTAGTVIDLHAGSIHESIDVVDPATGVQSIFLGDGSDPAITPLPSTFPARAGTAHYYYVGAQPADGHYLLGPCADFHVQGGVGVVRTAEPWDPWRGFALQFQAGSDVFSVTCFGKTVTYTAEVQ